MPVPLSGAAMHVETFHLLETRTPLRVPCDCDLGEDHVTSPRRRSSDSSRADLLRAALPVLLGDASATTPADVALDVVTQVPTGWIGAALVERGYAVLVHVLGASGDDERVGRGGPVPFELPFGDRVFARTIAAFVLDEVADPAAAVRELLRVTRQGGRVVLAVDSSRSAADATLSASILADLLRSVGAGLVATHELETPAGSVVVAHATPR